MQVTVQDIKKFIQGSWVGWVITLGAIVIDTKLHAVLVAVHLGIGILLFAMTLLTVLFAFRIGKQVIESRA